MKTLYATLLYFSVLIGFAQIPAYYSGINFSASPTSIKSQLANLITTTHTTPISYSEVWNALKDGDLDPTNSANVLLIYGYNDSDGDPETDRTRDKDLNGGSGGEWNREHVFAKSLGSPDLGTSGPGSDAHNLRASDVARNNLRGSRKFAAGSGNSSTIGADWYPGDEWKGDVARIVMYMYLRYSLQCRPIYVANGTPTATDANMVELLLTWNVEDPVSTLEENRNDVIQSYQGNRNPFIDNPKIATLIWGGPVAEDTWGNLSVEEESVSFTIYPNPVVDNYFYVSSSSQEAIKSIQLYNNTGQLVYSYAFNAVTNQIEVNVTGLSSGMYIANILTENNSQQEKIYIP